MTTPPSAKARKAAAKAQTTQADLEAREKAMATKRSAMLAAFDEDEEYYRSAAICYEQARDDFHRKHPQLKITTPSFTQAVEAKVPYAELEKEEVKSLPFDQLNTYLRTFKRVTAEAQRLLNFFENSVESTDTLLDLEERLAEHLTKLGELKPFECAEILDLIETLELYATPESQEEFTFLFGDSLPFVSDLKKVRKDLNAMTSTEKYKYALREAIVLEALRFQSLGLQSVMSVWKSSDPSPRAQERIDLLAKDLVVVCMPLSEKYRLGFFDQLCLDQDSALYEIPFVGIGTRDWRDHKGFVFREELNPSELETFIRLHRDGGYDTPQDVLDTVKALDL